MLEFLTKDQGGNPNKSSEESPCKCFFKAFAIFAGVMVVSGMVLLTVSLVKMFKTGAKEEIVAHWSMGVGLSLILLAMASVILSLVSMARTIREVEKTKDRFSALPLLPLKTGAEPREPAAGDLEQLQMQMTQAVRLLQDINENTLLDEAGRRKKYEFLAHQERKRIYNDIDRLVQDREWAQAKALLEGLMQKYPGNPEVQGYADHVDELRKQTFNEELAQVRKTINDLVAISAWDKAIRNSEILLEKHPDMAAAKELQLHVRAERNRFREEHIKKMAADIQRLIVKKRWNDAHGIAKQLMDRYPDSIEAEAIRGQINTLETNAEIEKRQDLEEQIKDLVRRRNFIQALELARFVIENYPTSPQASALRVQIEKLEELSKQQEKEIQL
jgi:hypothetical protein